MDTPPPIPPATPQGQMIWQPITTEVGLGLGHSPSHVQINTPQRIPQELRRPFEVGRAKIQLVVTASQERLPAMVAMIGETSLVADTDASTLWRKPGEKVLVVFPLPRQSYVLQTVIEGVAVQQLTLRYQDPRYDVRRHVPLASPAILRLIPPATVEAIKRRQVRLVRGISQPAAGTGNKQVIADRLHSKKTADPSVMLPCPQDTTALTCDLKDLSPGGMALTTAASPPVETLTHSLICVQLALPGVSGQPFEPDDPHLILDLLGVIRHVESTSVPWTIHIRFLARLPEDYAAYFERLEGT
jgi:hypothetical protein